MSTVTYSDAFPCTHTCRAVPKQQWAQPRGGTSACGNWHVCAQLEEGNLLSLEVLVRRMPASAISVPLDVKPESAGSPRLCRLSWARASEPSLGRPSHCGGSCRCFWVSAPQVSTQHRWPQSLLLGMAPSACITSSKASTFWCLGFFNWQILIKSVYQNDETVNRDNKGKDFWKIFN